MTAQELGQRFGGLILIGVVLLVGYWISRGKKEEDSQVPDIPKGA